MISATTDFYMGNMCYWSSPQHFNTSFVCDYSYFTKTT